MKNEKDEEQRVKTSLIGKRGQTEYEDIKQYVYAVAEIQNFKKFKVGEFRQGLKDIFEIKSDKKVDKIVRRLSRDGIMKADSGFFIVIKKDGKKEENK